MKLNQDTPRLRTLRHSAYDVACVRAMERPLLEQGIPLMTMASQAVAQVVNELLDTADIDVEDARIVVLAGAGDNGGDGLYAASELAHDGATVTAIIVGRNVHDGAFAAFIRSGGKVLVLDQASDIPGCASGFGPGEAGERLQTAIGLAAGADVLLDAMTGIGIKGALRGIPSALARALGCLAVPPDRPAAHDMVGDGAADEAAPLVVAIDTPSGIGVDDGTLPGAYIPADVTVMFGAMKACAMIPPAAYACGEVTLVDFGFDISERTPVVRAMDDELAARSIRLPRLDDSKYSRGVTGLITGSDRYPGAAVLTTRAAAHTNIGMVRYLGPTRVQDMVLANLPEAVMGKGRVQSWVVGSGVPGSQSLGVPDADGTGPIEPQRAAIAALLAHYDLDDGLDGNGTAAVDDSGDELGASDAQSEIEAYRMPALCVDAGALDLLPARVPAHVVITPHAGELAEILSMRGESLDRSDVLAEPWHWARRAHEITGATVLLKGAITIVVGEDEHGETVTMISGSAPAWLGTAGAGDVLAGMMGALLAQQDGMLQEDAAVDVEVAAAASYIHGLAAGLAARSDQRGWRAPAIFAATGSDDEDLGEISDGRTGGPVVAGDLIEAIAPVVSGLLA